MKSSNKLIHFARTGLLIVTILALFNLPNQLFAKAFSMTLSAGNVTAGEHNYLKVNSGLANAKVTLNITKPDGLIVTLVGLTDQNGEYSTVLDGYHLKTAGNYQFSSYFSSLGSETAVNAQFIVYPGEVNADKSTISADKLILSNTSTDEARVVVKLLDDYGNVVTGHKVKLLANRAEDKIVTSNSITDQAGLASFVLSTQKSGIVDLTALDITSGVVLKNRLSIKVEKMNDLVAATSLFKVANAEEAGPLAGFTIDDLPSTIKPNQNVSFTVKAVDSEENVVQDYTGTVRFSVEGTNSNAVNLPLDYKFVANDLGVHQFNLGLSFKEAGTYQLVVTDTADKSIKGTLAVVVDSGTVTPNTTGSEENKPVITAPVAGTYSNAVQTVSGTAKMGATIKVYNNDVAIGEVNTGISGKFNFQTPQLNEGLNTLYVTVIDPITFQVQGTSDKVEVNIDTKPPVVDEVKVLPTTGIKAGDKLTIVIYSEKNLSQAAVIFNGDIVELNPSIEDITMYSADIGAPTTAGNYPVDVLLADELGNEQTYEQKITVQVGPSGVTVINKDKKPSTGTTEPPATPTTPEVTPPTTTTPVEELAGLPSTVTGVIPYNSEKRVTLVWDAAKDDKGIKNYKIYYGSTLNQLNQVVTTKDASTTWYIPGLENGKEYFFAITAIDTDGNESAARSEIVSGVPFRLEINNALSERPTEQLNDPNLRPAAYSGPFPSNTTQTGPELLFLAIPSVALAGWFKRKKKQL